MNFKKNLKRFMTLDRHHAEGFTLVELIVVIAILAILGGVAVPAYSGYITKANKQADISLLGEIENALTLAYYNGDLSSEAGYLIIAPESLEDSEVFYEENPDVALAMQKTFGSSWEDMMQLKYNGWGVTSMTMSPEDAQAVVNSDFVKGYSANELMNQVQAMTEAVRKIDAALDDKEDLYMMYNYGSNSNVLDDLAKEYYGEDANWGTITDETTKSNLLVLATASSVGGNSTDASGYVSNYASYAAYAAVDPTFGAAYDTFVADVSKATTMEDAKEAYNGLVAAAGKTDYNKWAADPNNSNAAAFQQIMAGVNNAMKDNGANIIADLSNPDMFTSGIGSKMYNDYLASAYALAADETGMLSNIFAAWNAGEHKGEVLVYYAVSDGKLYVANSLPME